MDYSVIPWATCTDPEVARVGVTIVGEHAGDLLAEFVSAMRHCLGLNKILGTIHIYPTLVEANKFAAGVWKWHHAPQKALARLARLHTWRRGPARDGSVSQAVRTHP